MSNWKVSSTWYRPFNGGRVVKWVDSSGNIKTSVNMMPPNAQNIGTTASNAIDLSSSQTNDDTINFNTSAIDNSLSEVAKTFHWREFGNGAANSAGGGGTSNTYADASMLSTADDIAYVMDDGLTSLSGHNLTQDSTHNSFRTDGTDDTYNVTFIGTGLTLTFKDSEVTFGSTDDYDIIVDGVIIKTYDSGDTIEPRTVMVQNLPYGTHVFQLKVMASPGGEHFHSKEFTFHQPKKPPIPEDAVVLADYMLMADFVAQSSAGIDKISKGVRAVSLSRDVFCESTDNNTLTLSQDVNHTQGFTQYTAGGDADSDTSVKLRLASFSTNYIARGYQTDARLKLFIGDTDNDSNATRDNTASYGSYSYLTNNLTLGVNNFGANFVSGTNGSISSFEIVSPTHTSSHYSTFSTPYLDELVGGDRNMEQHNLIVTPDGKTWDEVTRDTSYIGSICVTAGTDTGSTSGSTFQIFDEWRGVAGAGGAYKPFMNKDFAISYDRIVCLVDGWYEIHSQTLRRATVVHCHIKVNGVTIQYAHGGSSDHDTPSNTVKVFLKRGDYIQNQGAWYISLDYCIFQISRL